MSWACNVSQALAICNLNAHFWQYEIFAFLQILSVSSSLVFRGILCINNFHCLQKTKQPTSFQVQVQIQIQILKRNFFADFCSGIFYLNIYVFSLAKIIILFKGKLMSSLHLLEATI